MRRVLEKAPHTMSSKYEAIVHPYWILSRARLRSKSIHYAGNKPQKCRKLHEGIVERDTSGKTAYMLTSERTISRATTSFATYVNSSMPLEHAV